MTRLDRLQARYARRLDQGARASRWATHAAFAVLAASAAMNLATVFLRSI